MRRDAAATRRPPCLRAYPPTPSPPTPLPPGERGVEAPSPPTPLPPGERGARPRKFVTLASGLEPVNASGASPRHPTRSEESRLSPNTGEREGADREEQNGAP